MSDRDESAPASTHQRADYGPTTGEEIVHAVTHGIGAVFALIALASLITYAAMHGSTQNVVAAAVFGTSLVLVYVSSTVYHAIPASWTRAKSIFQIFDHTAIHLLIAGTATPMTLCGIGGRGGWIGLGIIWTLALIGIIVETTPLRRRTRLSIACYVGNGWAGALAIPVLYTAISTWSLSLLLLGGIAYTAGVPFFLAHRRKWMHAYWHGFVLAGSALHVAAVVLVLR